MQNLTDKVAVVTGAGSGIGEGIARAAAAASDYLGHVGTLGLHSTVRSSGIALPWSGATSVAILAQDMPGETLVDSALVRFTTARKRKTFRSHTRRRTQAVAHV